MNSDLWTRSSTYREEYFKKNKGIFYKYYLCAYCRKKYLEKDIVEVDHCIAVSAVRKKWYFQLWFSIFNTNVNDTMNLVASCRKCNRTKGQKTGRWIIRGATGKVIHDILQTSSQLFVDSTIKYWYVYFLVFVLIAVKVLV